MATPSASGSGPTGSRSPTGTRPSARDNTGAAIEAFSGAITLKDDSMVGYLKRGPGLPPARRGRGGHPGPAAGVRDRPLGHPPARRAGGRVPGRHAAPLRLGRGPLRGLREARQRARRVSSTSWRSRATTTATSRAAIDALQRAIALDDRFAEAYYLLGLVPARRAASRSARVRAREVDRAAARRSCTRARSSPISYGAMGRTDDRLRQLQALAALDAGASREIALGLAYARAGQPERAVTTLGRATERYPDYPYAYVALGRVWLEIAQARNDRDRAEQGARSARGRGRQRRQQRGAHALRPRAAADVRRGDGRAHAAGRDAEAAGRSARLLLSGGRCRAARPLRRRPPARCSTTRSLRGDEPTPAAAAPTPRASATCRCRLNEPAAAATYFLRAAADATDAATCSPAPPTPSSAPATRTPHGDGEQGAGEGSGQRAGAVGATPNRRAQRPATVVGRTSQGPASQPALRIDPIAQSVPEEVEPEDQRSQSRGRGRS